MKLNVELENLISKVKILKSVDKNQSSTKCLIQENNKASHLCQCCDKFKEEIVDLKSMVCRGGKSMVCMTSLRMEGGWMIQIYSSKK